MPKALRSVITIPALLDRCRRPFLIGLILLLSFLPYLLLGALTPPGHTYTWNPYASDDYATYLFKMRLGAEGHWLYTSYYNFAENPRTLIFTFYTGLGRLAALTGLPALLLYQAVRLICGYLLLAKLHEIIRLFLTDERKALLTLWVTATLTFGTQELEIFDSLAEWPHFTLSTYLFLCLVHALMAGERPRYPLLGLVLLLLTLIHPHMVFPVALLYLLLRFRRHPLRENLWNLSLLGGPCALYGAYLFVIFRHPLYLAWLQQSGIDSVLAPYLMLCVLVGFPLAVVVRRAPWPLQAWLLTYLLCSLIPAAFRARMLEGALAAALVTVCAVLLSGALTGLRRWAAAYLAFAYIASWGYMLAFRYPQFARIARNSLYLTTDARDLFDWMERAGIRDRHVLANADISLWLPAYTFNRVYLGHYAETYYQKQKLAAILGLRQSGDLKTFVTEQGADYLVSYIRRPEPCLCYEILQDAHVQEAGYTRLYQNATYAVYQAR